MKDNSHSKMLLKDILARSSVFSSLNEQDLSALAEMAISRRYRKGQWIVHYADIYPYLLIVGQGEVTALKESSEGRSLIVLTLEAEDVFWGLAFFLEGAPMPVALVAETASQIHIWHRERLLPWLLQNGRISWELACLMVRRMQRASEIVEELAFQPVAGRLARLLLDHFGSAVEGFVSRDLTLDEMAARIGTTREIVCRQLYRFANQGAIHIKRTEFMIADREKLESYASKAKGS